MKNIMFLVVALGVVNLSIAQGSFSIGDGATVNSSGKAYLVLHNMSIINDGIFQQANGDGYVKVTGGINVTLSGSGSTGFNTLIVEKDGTASFGLLSDLNVSSKVNFTSGFLNLNNQMLNLGSTGIFTGESEFSRAFTTGSGYVEAVGVLNKPSAVDLGSLGAVITSPVDMGSTIIRRGHAVQAGVSGSNNSIQRYYDIIPSNNLNLKAELRFNYFDGELNDIPENLVYQWKSKNNVNWDFVGGETKDLSANYVEKKSINWFARWTLAAAMAPTITCPEDITISSNEKGCKALVSFAATVAGIPTPTITYSIGRNVISSPFVFSKGTTTVTATASNGVSPDAVCSFTVTVVCGKTTSPGAKVLVEAPDAITSDLAVRARPNPSNSDFALDIKSSSLEPVSLIVTDVLGRLLFTKTGVASNGTVLIGRTFAPGIYFVRVIQQKSSSTLKLIKQEH